MEELAHSVADGLSADADSASAEPLSAGQQHPDGQGPRIALSWQEPRQTEQGRFAGRSRAFIVGGFIVAAAMLAAGAAGFSSFAGTEPDVGAQIPLPPPVLDAGVLPPAFVQPRLLLIAVDEVEAEVPDGAVIEPDAPAAVATPLQLKAAEAVTVEPDATLVAAPVAAQPAVPARNFTRRENASRATDASRSWTGSFFERQN